ncbi:hypothetical protein [Psychrilyobacter atlanticus]|uniref:hypothetical protein n=1 Tax=Psychrilyobacter atlanticus TaxID=271091 RepID=UPI000427620E|nr:hypothetical protein [Psychrilyobacter atlanticus]
MGLLFDSSLYSGELLAKDIFYYLSKFRTDRKFSKLSFKKGITGKFEPLQVNGITAYFNDLIMIVKVSGSDNGKDIEEYMTYDEYLIYKDLGRPIDYLSVEFDDIFIGFKSISSVDTEELNSYTYETVLLNLGNGRYCIRLKSLFDEIKKGNVSFDGGNDFSTNLSVLQRNGYNENYLEFAFMVGDSKFSSGYPIDMLNFIKPKINNPFLYPTYFGDNKEINVESSGGGSGGGSPFSPIQAELISKALCKILLTVDPFERDERVLEGAGINNSGRRPRPPQ